MSRYLGLSPALASRIYRSCADHTSHLGIILNPGRNITKTVDIVVHLITDRIE